MLPHATNGWDVCIFTTDWIEAMWGEKRDGSAFTTGWPDFSSATEYNYGSRVPAKGTFTCRGSSMEPQWK